MLKSLSMAMVLLLLLATAACGSGNGTAEPADSSATATQPESGEAAGVPQEPDEPQDQVELIVFAAASMTETLEEISRLYKEIAPHVSLVFNFDSSGTLKTQIQEGADCDVFISAGQLQMNQLDITADEEVNAEPLDFVLQGSSLDLLENRVALCVPDGNAGGIEGFDDLADKLVNADILLAMGNSDVPVGQYTQKILEYYGLDEDALANGGKITYGTNVKEVTTQVSEASVSCGVVYCTDAYSAGLEIVDYATAEMCGQVIYPAAVLNASDNQQEALQFLEYLRTGEAMAVFENVGFAAVYSNANQ